MGSTGRGTLRVTGMKKEVAGTVTVRGGGRQNLPILHNIAEQEKKTNGNCEIQSLQSPTPHSMIASHSFHFGRPDNKNYWPRSPLKMCQ